MSRRAYVVILVCGLVFIDYRPAGLFAQGIEYQRIRAGTLPGEKEYATEEEEKLQTSITGGALPSQELITLSQEAIQPKEYTVVPEDVLEVFVWQNADVSKDVIVSPDGKISYPLVGTVQAAGLTIPQLEGKIREEMAQYIKSPQVSIMLKKTSQDNVNKITILGAVARPGIYTYKGAINLLEALALAGDFIERARQDSINIVRGNLTQQPEVIKIDLSRIISEISKEAANINIVLKPNDIIYVPKINPVVSKKIIILGEVAYPGIYTFKDTINLIEAIALAGDFTENAREDSVLIVRGNLTGQPWVTRINMLRVLRRGTSNTNIVLKPDDIIYVPKSFIANFNKFLNNLRPTFDNTLTVLDIRKEIRRIEGHIR